MKPSYPKPYSGATRKRLSQSEYYKLYPNAKKQVQNTLPKNNFAAKPYRQNIKNIPPWQ